MHDPSSIAWELKRPWPQKTTFGKYYPAVLVIWHEDPELMGDDDSCNWFRQHGRPFLRDIRWYNRALHPRWHVWHWRLQVPAIQNLKRWLFSRCAACHKRFPFGYAPVSNSWYGRGPSWFRGEKGVFHSECDRAVNYKTEPIAHDSAGGKDDE